MIDLTAALFMLAVYAVVVGGLGAYISIQKGRPSMEGAILAFLMGPFGAVVAVLLPTIETTADPAKRDIATDSPPKKRYSDAEWAVRQKDGGAG